MTTELTTLSNGVRVATHRMPNLETVSRLGGGRLASRA